MKQKIVRLNCDVCNKETEFLDGKEEYPYSKGWCYLYSFNGKVATKNTHKLHVNFVDLNHVDKHFCSVKCLGNFLNDKVTSAHKKSIVREDELVDNDKIDYWGDDLNDKI